MVQKSRYSLPPSPAEVTVTLEKFCRSPIDLPIADLKKHVDSALERLQVYTHSVLGPNLNIAHELAERCHYLLDHYDTYSSDKQALIRGAVRYFVVQHDARDDTLPAVGFDDDIRVINFVLDKLGIEGKFLEGT